MTVDLPHAIHSISAIGLLIQN